MQCAQCSPRLFEYLEGELRAPAAARVRAHVAACAACRTELAHCEQLRAAIAAAPLPGGAPDAPNWDVFEARVLAHTREHGTARRGVLGQWLQPTAAAAALAGLVLLLGGRAATPPLPTDADPMVAAMDAEDAAALAAELDLAWDRPLQWDMALLVDGAAPDAMDAVPLLLAEALQVESLAATWTDESVADGEDDWLTDLETLDTETFEAFLKHLATPPASEGVT